MLPTPARTTLCLWHPLSQVLSVVDARRAGRDERFGFFPVTTHPTVLPAMTRTARPGPAPYSRSRPRHSWTVGSLPTTRAYLLGHHGWGTGLDRGDPRRNLASLNTAMLRDGKFLKHSRRTRRHAKGADNSRIDDRTRTSSVEIKVEASTSLRFDLDRAFLAQSTRHR